MTAAVRFVTFALCALTLLAIVPAYPHDQKHPGLDAWYGKLTRPGMESGTPGSGCCNLTDCHTTSAEMRGTEWYAKVGKPKGNGEWELMTWKMVPKDKILEKHDNPTGEPVICHSLPWEFSVTGSGTFKSDLAEIYCFVPSNEY